MLITHALASFSLLIASPAIVESNPLPAASLQQIYSELRSLRRLVRELLIAARNDRLARCEVDQEHDQRLRAQLDAEEQAANTRIAELEAELSERDLDPSRGLELQEELQSLRRTVLEPLSDRRAQLESRISSQERICTELRTAAAGLVTTDEHESRD